MSDFIPQFKPRLPGKLANQPWLSTKEPQVILVQGMRGAGKGVTVDNIAEKLYTEGFLILHIWAARSFENLYWAICKNCNIKYDQWKKEYEANYRIENPNFKDKISFGLHCKCHKAYPILWVVPDYIKIVQETLDRFNGAYWSGIEEFNTSYWNGENLRNSHELLPNQRKILSEGNLKKPVNLIHNPLIVVRQITTPTSAQRREIFCEQFTNIVLEAREQHRIVVMNPAIFEGQVDKFETLTEIIRMIPNLMNKSGHFKPLTEKQVGKPRSEWTKWERSYHKVAIVINELRSVAPSNRLSGESKASATKKAIYDFIPEARHNKAWFVGDYQNPDDLFAGVRYQANIVIIKRASKLILGNDWEWLYKKIDFNREGMIKYRFHGEGANDPLIKRCLDYARPRVDDLPDNKGYVTFVNGEIKLETFEMPGFHHKTSMDDFKADTGIDWTVTYEKKPNEVSESTASEVKIIVKKKKIQKEEILKKIDYMVTTEKKSFKQIKDDLVSMESERIIPDLGYKEKSPIYFNNMYLRWKKKHG